MCILALRLQSSSRFPVVVVCNRDEFESRETHPFELGPDGVLCARDVQAGGTQCGIDTATGLFAALTNVRKQREAGAGWPSPPPSRGAVVSAALRDPGLSFPPAGEPGAAGEGPLQPAPAYAGFNLFQVALSERAPSVRYWTNSRDWTGPAEAQTTGMRLSEAGYHCCSNSWLDDASWPKVRHLKARMQEVCEAEGVLPEQAVWDPQHTADALGAILCDTPGLGDYPPELDDAQVNHYAPMEKQLQSNIWVRGEMPGLGVHRTRFQTVLVAERGGCAGRLVAHVWYRSTDAPDKHGDWVYHKLGPFASPDE
eukprot:TRINITY_DN60938_c0_g1_i1.p2 TRINITY_DN60938_c0_g1~~TRINITY_DN60938_c0_g1_i1.p2  ORF type:complete len:311 (+),score=81.21 TRINITY_DN60938_c0_g1_i1:85-1017(+)